MFTPYINISVGKPNPNPTNASIGAYKTKTNKHTNRNLENQTQQMPHHLIPIINYNFPNPTNAPPPHPDHKLQTQIQQTHLDRNPPPIINYKPNKLIPIETCKEREKNHGIWFGVLTKKKIGIEIWERTWVVSFGLGDLIWAWSKE